MGVPDDAEKRLRTPGGGRRATRHLRALCRERARADGLDILFIRIDKGRSVIPVKSFIPALTNNVGFRRASGEVVVVTGPETFQASGNLEIAWTMRDRMECAYSLVFKANTVATDYIAKGWDRLKGLPMAHILQIPGAKAECLTRPPHPPAYWYFMAAAKRHAILSPGCSVVISVKDMGEGIPPKFLPRIFDPYFTTKQTGSGLGLPTAYSIVRKHGGFIDVSSIRGGGSTFEVYLPAHIRTKAVTEQFQQTRIWKGAGRVLVMDDDEPLQMIFREMLETLGFEAVCVENGKVMLDVYRQAAASGKRFEAVILDLTIRGGMGGKDAMEHLIKLDPAVKAFATSGYFDSPVMVSYKEYGFCGILPKPISLGDLAEKLRSVLET